MTTFQDLPSWCSFFLAAIGGSSGWMFVHPFDVLKVRLQVSKGSKLNTFGGMFSHIWSKEGFFGFWGGLSAALTRQCTYTTFRIGLYEFFKSYFYEATRGIPLVAKVACSAVAGSLAVTLCCPVEIALVRMQADGIAPPSEKRNYAHVFDAIFRTWKKEGFFALYRGLKTTVVRGIIVCIFQLTTYDQAKIFIKTQYKFLNDGLALHALCGLIAGFVYSFISMPIDICKTRIQNQKPDSEGKLQYNNVIQALGKIATEEGLTTLWNGYGPYFARSGGHTVMMYIFIEQYRSLFIWLFDNEILETAVGGFVFGVFVLAIIFLIISQPSGKSKKMKA